MKYRIVPASTAAAILGMELFGLANINPGSWLEPVTADVEDDEFQPARDLLREKGFDLERE